MNHIQNIEIKNFKSIRYQKIEDCRRVNVFIGYPNTGKSNILEALSLFSINQNEQDFNSFVRIEKLTTLFFNGEIKKQPEIRINDKHRIVIRFNNDYVVIKHQYEREGTSFTKEDTQNIFLDDSADVWEKKSYQLWEGNKKIGNYKSTNIGKENELAEIKKYEFFKQIQYLNKDYFSLSIPYGSNLFNIISTNPDLQKEINGLFLPYNLELLYESREQKFSILKRTLSGIFSIPYELIADTLQRLIFFKTAIASNSNSVLLFEEPEAQMFPPYISKLTGDIWYKKDNQYFLTTHSPFVINDFLENAKDELAVYIVEYKDGETIIKRLTDDQLTEIYQYGIDLFFNVESLAE